MYVSRVDTGGVVKTKTRVTTIFYGIVNMLVYELLLYKI